MWWPALLLVVVALPATPDAGYRRAVGTLVRLGPDSLVLSTDARTLSLGIHAVRRLEVSGGRRGRAGMIAAGAGLGALWGALAPAERWTPARLP